MSVNKIGAGCGLVVVLLAAWAFTPDVVNERNRGAVRGGFIAVGKTAYQAGEAVTKKVASNYTPPEVKPSPQELQTAAMVKVAEELGKVPNTIATTVAHANAQQRDDINRQLAQQNAALLKTAEVAQATLNAVGSMNTRVDKLDAAVKQLQDKEAKAASSPKEEVKPAAQTEEPEAKEDNSSSTEASSAPVGNVVTSQAPSAPLVLREAANSQRSTRCGRR